MSLFNLDKIKQTALDAVQSVQDKVSEIKESESVNQLLQKADELKDQALSKADSIKESALQQFEEKKALAEKYALAIQENETIKGILAKGNGIVEVVGDRFNKISNDEDVLAVWNKTTEISSAVGKTSLKGLKVVSGVSAVMNRKEAIATREEADKLKAEIESTNESIRDDLNEALVQLYIRLSVLLLCLIPHIFYLDRI